MIYWKRWLKNENNVDWTKGKRELSAKEMIDFIVAVAFSEAVPLWETIVEKDKNKPKERVS